MSVLILNQATPIALNDYLNLNLENSRVLKYKSILKSKANDALKQSFIGHLFNIWMSPLN